MQILTLSQLKVLLGVTDTAEDAKLEDMGTRAENELLQYCNLADMDAFYAAFGEMDQARAALEQAVVFAVYRRLQDLGADIWAGGTLGRLLMPYRVPAFSSGTTE
jgi:hypothetical protein